MVERYRCSNCGYYHLGPAPEVCPVCGAPKSAFLPYDGPGDLTGTKTLENLQAAFAGESQANRRYTLYKRIAELEGDADAAAAFDYALTEETAHALGHLAYAAGFGDTAADLETAIGGEDYETTTMYPEFARVAKEEGFPEIAQYFKMVGFYEKKHHDRFKQVRDSMGG
jgi:rubrerythrin